MTEVRVTEHKHPNYMGIFWILLSVTVLEVGYSLMKVPRPILIIGDLGTLLLVLVLAAVVAGSGFDWLLLDTEHSPNELTMVQSQLQAMTGGTATPVVRPAWNDPVLFKRFLDIGFPMLVRHAAFNGRFYASSKPLVPPEELPAKLTEMLTFRRARYGLNTLNA